MGASTCDWGYKRLAKTITGQCHKYHPYEISPSLTSGFELRILTQALFSYPRCNINAVPKTGKRATKPGKGVNELSRKAGIRIDNAEINTIQDLAGEVSVFKAEGLSAKYAPAMNSQILHGVPKKANRVGNGPTRNPCDNRYDPQKEKPAMNIKVCTNFFDFIWTLALIEKRNKSGKTI